MSSPGLAWGSRGPIARAPRLPALHPLILGDAKRQIHEGLPGADIKNTGDNPCLQSPRIQNYNLA